MVLNLLGRGRGGIEEKVSARGVAAREPKEETEEKVGRGRGGVVGGRTPSFWSLSREEARMLGGGEKVGGRSSLL